MNKRLIYIVWLSFLLAFFTNFTPTKSPIRIELTPRQKGSELWTTMTILNQSSKPVYLNKIDIGMDNRLLNKLFIVKQGQQEVEYTGVMVKRRAPTADDFVLLKPGQRVRTTIRLDQSYAFSPGRHRYSIQYRHYHSSPTNQDFLQELTSAVQPFTYKAAGEPAGK